MPEIRDQIYGDIVLTDLEMRILDTEDFQRLRRLYQLPSVQFVYPTATHTRFAQSIGTLQMASEIASNITKDRALTREEIKYARIAALLSDIEDPPYSTVFFEDDVNREIISDLLRKIRKEKLKRISEEVNRSSDQIDYTILEKIFSANSPDDEYYFIKQIINSEVGADRLDYLERDSRACGIPYGYIDSRILREFTLHEKEVVLRKEAIPIVDNILHSLYQMVYTAYAHKVSRAVIRMIRESYHSHLAGKRKYTSMQKLLEFDDACFIDELQESERNDQIKHITNLKQRNLIRMVYSLDMSTIRDANLIDRLYNLPNYKELEEQVSQEIGTKVYLDPVSPKPLSATPINLLINSEVISLDKSPLLKEWYNTNMRKGRKLFMFCYINKEQDNREEIKITLGKLFNCFRVGFDQTPQIRVPALNNLYNFLNTEKHREEKERLQAIVTNLPPHIFKSLIELTRIGRATADDLSQATNRSRSLESLYLNELCNMRLVTKSREAGKEVIFSPDLNIMSILEDIGYIIQVRK